MTFFFSIQTPSRFQNKPKPAFQFSIRINHSRHKESLERKKKFRKSWFSMRGFDWLSNCLSSIVDVISFFFRFSFFSLIKVLQLSKYLATTNKHSMTFGFWTDTISCNYDFILIAFGFLFLSSNWNSLQFQDNLKLQSGLSSIY